jgi:hypothetical protein
MPIVNTRRLAARLALERLEGQLAALVLFGKDITPVLAKVTELRNQVLRRQDPGVRRVWPTEKQLRQRIYNRRYRARLAKLAASR